MSTKTIIKKNTKRHLRKSMDMFKFSVNIFDRYRISNLVRHNSSRDHSKQAVCWIFKEKTEIRFMSNMLKSLVT